MPAASRNHDPAEDASIRWATESAAVEGDGAAGSGSGVNATTSTAAGRMATKAIGMAMTVRIVGTMLKPANTVAENGSNWPVSFSTMFRALPWVACDKAMELDGPLAQITQPE